MSERNAALGTGHSRVAAGGGWTQFVAFALILTSYAPLLALHFRRLWVAEFYRFFPLILVAVALLAWDRYRTPWQDSRPVSMEKTGRWIMLGLVTLGAAVWMWSPWVAAISAILICRALFGVLSARKRFRFVAVWILLLFLIPAPMGLDREVHAEMLRWTTHGGSYLLDFFGRDHWLHARTLYLVDRAIPIEQLSGGVGFVLMLTAISLSLMVWMRRPLRHSIAFVFCAIFWAVIFDALRVATAVWLAEELNIDLTGLLVRISLDTGALGIALVMLFCTDALLIFVFLPMPRMAFEPDDDLPDTRPPELMAPELMAPEFMANTESGPEAIQTHPPRALAGLIPLTVGFVLLGIVQILHMAGLLNWPQGMVGAN